MDLVLLEQKARIAKDIITGSKFIDKSNLSIAPILGQLDFIISHSEQGSDPRAKLKNGQKFTFSIIASREFCSPDEQKVKSYLDELSREMYHDDYS
ncbi:hypothetical protein FLM48_18000 [Shewanella sp. Scap07]|uniref:hypothetical protein n=1 Tax=Shewanella sp. Scap07 TaxID=2589987 RepID=UPI0015BE4A7E|nr:hypothetical protein [Shewanella sp. Scap07]QLE86795.1 hypothetical protein FLM48_18000 [Shewanella sp. Scap07]